jgi:hypothetical protein
MTQLSGKLPPISGTHNRVILLLAPSKVIQSRLEQATVHASLLRGQASG